MPTAYVMSWTEFERGWGQRPDGVSLHASPEDFERYVKAFYDRRPKGGPVPDEYEQPDGAEPKAVEISAELETALRHAARESGGLRLGRGSLTMGKSAQGRPMAQMEAGLLARLLAEAEKAVLDEAAKGASPGPKRAM